MAEKKILCIGLVCIDTIYEVSSYPVEDSDQRCISQQQQRGGNASNNCSLLGILGARPHFFGTIANSRDKTFIENDFKEFGIDYSKAVTVDESECPNSVVIISKATGSRTIIHSNKNLRELSLSDFCQLPLEQYFWIHFEGRNISAVQEMIKHVNTLNESRESKIKISVEIEKTLPQIFELFPLADFVFVSKEYAQFRGWMDIQEALSNASKLVKEGATVICPWGDRGAGAQTGSGAMSLSPPFPPAHVVDTLGAGDTFIASTIFSICRGKSLEESVTFGCRVAGFKIGFKGWTEFRHRLLELDFVKEMVGTRS
ncbi:UNVERIFIED_CONTAM: hypothetical protein GTU68_045842 [Idotea baltica]|nr:hypothetical protein [Idotea baltica]